jgi:bifunctional UDP-N-acetylglucosamine pyrophosphorylase/glucosamine-1-phosphate N-acetyltransferase
VVDNDMYIEHSVLVKKKLEKVIKPSGEVQKVRFYLPMPEGIDTISNL